MNRSGIITLITDFGHTDAYIAMMKGVILSINKNAVVVDITNSINTGAIFQAAGILKETYKYFPEGTVHVAVVDPGVGSKRKLMAFETENHFFVGPDNGLFWPILETAENPVVVELSEEKYFLKHISRTFHGRQVFAPVAAHLSMGVEVSQLGQPITDPVAISMPRPHVSDKTLFGEVIRVDNFGNIITNISDKDLIEFIRGSTAVIRIGDLKIEGLSRIYTDADEGELIAVLNSSDLLEIAVNMGRASQYIGMEPNEIIGTVVEVIRQEI
ncbi:S-adenosyl-l-methionine hydroxide adenosyltransferase family protein [Thermodesulfobacteriota bacterium]